MSSIGDDAPATSHGTVLVLFGIVEIAAGVLYLAKAVIYALLSVPGVASLPARYGGLEVPLLETAVSLPPASFFLAIGFGSILARRWARALALAFSALWLAAGTLGTVFLAFCLPRIFAALKPLSEPAARSVSLSPEIRAYACIALVGVVLPGASVLFYASRATKAECERRDPDERWTDRVPLAALATAMLLAVGALLALDLGFSPSRQILFFGHPLGAGARAAAAAVAAVEIAAAWGVCRMDRRAWAAAAAVMALRGAADAAIALRIARTGLGAIAAAAGPVRPESRAAIERLEPLHPLGMVAAFVTALAIAAFAFVGWNALRFGRARARAAADSP